ncbi:ABC transporter permease [Aureimonas pseudogalii]|uniref:Putative spermidine/putrescine transport system permease protein n=1 Tax=Aureimonas pseudogalii TaxID=1744844 RepID=A0A7W6H6R6_9HYPH|nr:ABC transporter permease [Aureimonas pseudogalii]MBB3999607.1 putative spermidine/putrescine transport system permease protein [Aureimonas pseudogalii]
MAASDRPGLAPYLQVAPMMLVFLVFLVVPLVFIVMVSFWTYENYQIQPAFEIQNYLDVFDRCIVRLPTLCTTFRTYLSTLGFCAMVWALTLGVGFTIAYFLAFEVRSKEIQSALFLVCTIPFWTSNVIRMISWIPLLGRSGLVNQTLMGAGLIDQPIEWLLYSSFSVTLTFVHLFTFFMVVPIYNSMLRIDRSLIEAARDGGASGWQILWNVIVPLSKTGIAIGSIFVITIVMGDFITVGLMGGQQIASVGKTIQTEISYLQFPVAAANSVVLLATVLLIIFALTRVVDIRKEL